MRWEENRSRCRGSSLWLSGANTLSEDLFSLSSCHFFRCLARHQRVASVFLCLTTDPFWTPHCSSLARKPLARYLKGGSREQVYVYGERLRICGENDGTFDADLQSMVR